MPEYKCPVCNEPTEIGNIFCGKCTNCVFIAPPTPTKIVWGLFFQNVNGVGWITTGVLYNKTKILEMAKSYAGHPGYFVASFGAVEQMQWVNHYDLLTWQPITKKGELGKDLGPQCFPYPTYCPKL